MCFSPIYINNTAYPCGKCLDCKRQLRSEWSRRLAIEMYYSILLGEKAYFITLTYSDENVPKSNEGFNSLSKRDVQLFFKRLRKLDEKLNFSMGKIKYFICGEYGPNTLRPHYHAVIFGFNPEFNLQFVHNVISSSWGKGFVQDIQNDLCVEQIQYCSQYMCKPDVTPDPSCIDSFRLMSKNLSLSYLSPNNIYWHFNKSNKEDYEDFKKSFESFKFFDSISRYDNRRNRDVTFEQLDYNCYFDVKTCHDSFTPDEICKFYIPTELFNLSNYMRDYLPSNIVPYVSGKRIPRYLREKIFSKSMLYVLNVKYLVDKYYDRETERKKLGMNEVEFSNYLEDKVRLQENQVYKYYENVVSKKIVNKNAYV